MATTSPEQIRAWHEDEREGYAGLGLAMPSGTATRITRSMPGTGSRLPDRRFARVLGFGSAYGDELQPWPSGSSAWSSSIRPTPSPGIACTGSPPAT
jgi:hypothetical protein